MPTPPTRELRDRSVHDVGAAMVEQAGLAAVDAVVGVAAYSADTQTVLYRDDHATGDYAPDAILDILDQIRLETIGVGAVESLHDSDLRAFVRLYEDLDTVVVPTDDTSGVVVAHDPDADAGVDDVVTAVEDGFREALDD